MRDRPARTDRNIEQLRAWQDWFGCVFWLTFTALKRSVCSKAILRGPSGVATRVGSCGCIGWGGNIGVGGHWTIVPPVAARTTSWLAPSRQPGGDALPVVSCRTTGR
jgi:hypothetical protein